MGCSRLDDGCGFNPRPRAGGDQLMDALARRVASVSIRAPVRGATIMQPECTMYS